MAGIASFIWFTIVIVGEIAVAYSENTFLETPFNYFSFSNSGILVSSLAMISMGAACWSYCDTVPLIAQYLVITGSIFFCLLILLLLLTFCICTSSGDLKISGGLKIILGISVTVMYIFITAGSTLLFMNSSQEDNLCKHDQLITTTESYDEVTFKTTAPRTADFCTDTLPVFTHSVLVVFNLLLFFSLLVTFYDDSK